MEILLEQIAAGSSTEEVVAEYPQLSREDVLAAVAYAREALSTDSGRRLNPADERQRPLVPVESGQS